MGEIVMNSEMSTPPTLEPECDADAEADVTGVEGASALVGAGSAAASAARAVACRSALSTAVAGERCGRGFG